jgi:FkbM family methyltransferase
VRVLAFEPDAYSLDKLRRNVASNRFDNITICPYALSDKDEFRMLAIDQTRNRGASSLLKSRTDDAGSDATVEVPCKPLLEALRTHGVERISALKIDVEGYEYPVLKKFLDDAPASLYPKAIVVEVLGNRIAAAGGSPVELLVSRGYRIVNHNKFNFLMELNRPRAA